VLARVDDCLLLLWHHRLRQLLLLDKLLVEVGKVLLDLRFVGGLDLSLHQLGDVQGLEPRVLQDLINSVGSKTRPFIFI